MDNPENTEGVINNGQSREYRRGDQQWTIQRIQKGRSIMDNPENKEGTINNGHCRETGNIGYTRRRKTKQKHSTICWTPLCANRHKLQKDMSPPTND